MNNKISKNQILLVVLVIFTISFVFYTGLIFFYKKNDLINTQKNIQSSVDKLYSEVHNTMLKKELQIRAEMIFKREDKDLKLFAFKNKDRKKLKELFMFHFKGMKKQIKGFNIMHFYDPKGNSILRMHNPSKYGDNLMGFRPCVKSLVANPRTCSFFEVGIHGLAYRYTKPVYLNEELIGFFELGVRPITIIKKIETIFDTKSYFILDKKYIPKDIKIELGDLPNSDFKICKSYSKKDELISENLSKLDFSKKYENKVKYKNKTYSIVFKDILDAQKNRIGKIILFHDISIFEEQLETLLIKSLVLYIVGSVLIYFILNGYLKVVYKRLDKARYLLDNTNDAVYVVDLKDGTIVDINERASLILGFKNEQLIGKNICEITKQKDEKNINEWDEFTNELKLNHFLTKREFLIKRDSTKLPVEASISYIKDENSEYMIAVARDITNQLEMENNIKQKAKELERLQKVISRSVLYTTSDIDGKITSVSKAFEEFSGYKEKELIGKNHSLFRNPDTPKEFYKNMWEVLNNNEQFVGELKNFDKDRNEYWLKITIDPIFDDTGKKIGYSSYRENITEKKEIEYISIHDSLTDIYNRAYFKKELSKKIKSAMRYDQNFGLIMFDIDHFKSVNDTYGHQVGDDVLINMANCISKHIREDDIFARWGGEEFIIIANGADMESLKMLTEKIQKSIKETSFEPVSSVTASFGLTIFKNGDNEESIQKRADDGLYKAKNNGRDRYEVEL